MKWHLLLLRYMYTKNELESFLSLFCLCSPPSSLSFYSLPLPLVSLSLVLYPPSQECRRIRVECIVAPYEADAQLAYLEKEGIVDLVITEDSDLLVFGCKRVLFKMDDSGNGKLIDLERDSLGKANKNLIVSRA